MLIVDTEKPQTKLGRPELPPEKLRGGWYKFRVNQVERELLEGVGTSTFWRDVCVNMAAALEFKEKDTDTIGTVIELTLKAPEFREVLRGLLEAVDAEGAMKPKVDT